MMLTTCDAANYIVANAVGGQTHAITCRNVLRRAWGLTRHFRNNSWQNTTGEAFYLEYVDGNEDEPERTQWLINWLFNQTQFPKELPERWGENPIITQELNIPDAMNGLREAAIDFVNKNCFDDEEE